MPGLNQIQGGRWDRLLRTFFPIKEKSIAPVLAPELVGYVTVQEWEPDMFWARGERLAWMTVGRAAVVAEFVYFQLFNPNGSGSLVMFEKLWLFSPTAPIIEIRYLTGALSGGIRVATGPRDQRFANVPNIGATVAQMSHRTTGAAIGTASSAQVQLEAGVMKEIEFSAIIPPNESILIASQALNVALSVTPFWRERPVEGTELV